MSILLALSNEESFFLYCVRAFPPNALECGIIWNKADKEMENQMLSGTKGHFLCLSSAQSCESPKAGTKSYFHSKGTEMFVELNLNGGI